MNDELKAALPETLDGHWSTPEGHEMAERYAVMKRTDLALADRPDFAVANAVYLVDRYSLDLIVMQTAAKERIRWLSVQLAIARAALASPGPGGGSDSQSMLHQPPEQPPTSAALREKVEELAQSLVGWPVDKTVQERYDRTNWQQGYDCAATEASGVGQKLLEILAAPPVQHVLGGDEARAWQTRSENLELALSKVSHAARRVLDARDAFLSPDAGRHSNLLRDEAEAWIELRQVFNACNPDLPSRVPGVGGQHELKTSVGSGVDREAVEPLYPISKDGPHEPDQWRRWLARQLMDSKLDDGEAYSIVAYHPKILDTLGRLPAAPSPGPSVEEMGKVEDANLSFLDMLHALRADEGDSVTLLCDNPDGPPNNAIECSGGWTDWQDERFSGDTLLAATRAAYNARRAAALVEKGGAE